MTTLMFGLVFLLAIGVTLGAIASTRRTNSGFGNARLGGRRVFGPSQQRLSDAEAEAQRWIDRLSGSIVNLDGGTDTAARQAVADAAERLTAASSQLSSASSVTQFMLVSQTAIEGMYYIRAARIALGLDPGPNIPELDPHGRFGSVTQARQVSYDGHDYVASPSPGPETPYYYPGGVEGGSPVPAGWYSTPWWKTAMVAGAAGVGGMMLIEALLGGGIGGLHGPGGGFGGRGGPGGPGGFGGGGFGGW